MSETKKDESIVDVNVALVLAENKRLIDLNAEKDGLIEELSKKLTQATDLIEEEDRKSVV